MVGAAEGLVAVLYAPAAWGWTRQAPLDAKGNFAFDDLPPGRYRLKVGGQVRSTTCCSPARTGSQLASIDLAVGRRSVIRGRVADAAGQPKADRVVTLKRDSIVIARHTHCRGRHLPFRQPARGHV